MRGKEDNFELFHIFGKKPFLKKFSSSHGLVKTRLYVNFIAVRKYDFLDYFLLCFVYKIFAVTILNIIP